MRGTYSVTLERGRDGTYLAWVHELPGCAVRGAREEVLAELPDAIAGFLAWAGKPARGAPRFRIDDETDSEIEADEDTEVLVTPDRRPLTREDWLEIAELLARSRAELLDVVAGLADEDLDATREGSSRSVREEIRHVAFVELMYAAWTFDLRSRRGLRAFLAWTRHVASGRMEDLADAEAADPTWAEWAGAPRPEPWTPRKAARRLLWHELLHLQAIQRHRERASGSRGLD